MNEYRKPKTPISEVYVPQEDGSVLIVGSRIGFYAPPMELIKLMIDLNNVKIEESKSAKEYYDIMS